MGVKSFLSKPLASYIVSRQNAWSINGEKTQKSIFRNLIREGKNTLFGRDHSFESIRQYDDFKSLVPVRDYEDFKPYISKVLAGEKNILWKGKPLYFAKTSGTTSGIKYIPISKESIPYHINGARDALLNYIEETGKSEFLNHKLIFLSGSPEMEKKNGIFIGRLSGIVNHHVPSYLKTNQLPSYSINCIDDWEEKLEQITIQTMEESMSLISGIPPWVQMYFDKLIEKTGKPIKEIFPDFSLFVYGGVNFEPYKNKLFQSIGKEIDSIETYPASEGFIAFQNSQKDVGMLLLLNSGIFYEFIPAAEYFSKSPERYTIEHVQLGVNYAIVMSTNAGLWAYSLGDTIKFTSLKPYKIIVTGRLKHFISAFGEHVIGEEIEKSMQKALSIYKRTEIVEFTVAPQVNPQIGLPHHEWLIEFTVAPEDLTGFENILNDTLMELNTYYKDLIDGKILRNLKIKSLPPDSFRNYMKSVGKLGGQNKVPRLSNDRIIADKISSI